MSETTKLHETIIHSSIWREDHTTRLVWVTMLAMAKAGKVLASIGGLADAARVTRDECVTALAKLHSPDADSRTKLEEGRRIREVDGGWFIINYRKYSGGRDEEELRKKARTRMQQLRAKRSQEPVPVTPCSRERREQKRTEANTGEPKRQSKGITEGADSENIPTTNQSQRVAKIMHRKLTTPWQDNEVAAYKKIGRIQEEDMAALERYYAKHWPPNRDRNILRHDLLTLLNNFQGEIGRAHADEAKNNPKKADPKHEDPDGWRDWLASTGHFYVPYQGTMSVMRTAFEKWRKEAAGK